MANNDTAHDMEKNVKDAARDAAHDVKQGVNRLADDAKEALHDATHGDTAERLKQGAADMANAAKDKGAELANAAKDKGAELAAAARDGADRLYRVGERRAQDLADNAGVYADEAADMVRRNPMQALGIAAGVGFLVGLVLARR